MAGGGESRWRGAKLSVGAAKESTDAIILEDQVPSKSLQALVEGGYVKAGDLARLGGAVHGRGHGT